MTKYRKVKLNRLKEWKKIKAYILHARCNTVAEIKENFITLFTEVEAYHYTRTSQKAWGRYMNACRILTEYHKDKRWDMNTRGLWEGMQIDHIVPKSFGFKYGIPVELISCRSNLQFITKEENEKKGNRLNQKARHLLATWGYDFLLEREDVIALFI